jgi:hypothetical protein
MCAETLVQNNLARAMVVLIIGGGCLGWIGNKAVDYTFSDVRQNTEARIEYKAEIRHVQEDVAENTDAIKDFAMMKELMIRMDERLSQWEPHE